MTSNAELLRRYAEEHSDEAFAELVRRHLNPVYFAALRQVASPHHAEDVTQAVFTDLARKAAELSRRPVLASWLHTSTRFAAAKARRSEQRRQRYEQEAEAMNSLHRDEAHAAEWERLRPLIDDVVHELNERDREAVLLRFFEGRHFAEIGAALQLSEDAARMRVERALDKLHTLLMRRGVTSTAAALGIVLANQGAIAAPAILATTVTGAALAGAAIAGSEIAVTGGWIGLMSTSKSVFCGVGVILFLGTAVGFYQFRNGRRLNDAMAAERRAVFVMASRVSDTEQQVQATFQRVPEEQQSASDSSRLAGENRAPEVEMQGPFGPTPPGSRARGRALMAAFPEIKHLLVQEKRAYFSALYKKLYQELGLTEAQTEAFELIMISGVSSTYGDRDPNKTVTLDAAPAMSSAEKKQRLRQLLGERGFQRFEEFQRSPQDRRVVQLASELYFTDTPLTAEQGARFQQVLAARNRQNRDQAPAEYWATVRAESVAFLREPQLAELSGLQARDEYNFARIQNQRLRAETKSGNPNRK